MEVAETDLFWFNQPYPPFHRFPLFLQVRAQAYMPTWHIQMQISTTPNTQFVTHQLASQIPNWHNKITIPNMYKNWTMQSVMLTEVEIHPQAFISFENNKNKEKRGLCWQCSSHSKQISKHFWKRAEKKKKKKTVETLLDVLKMVDGIPMDLLHGKLVSGQQPVECPCLWCMEMAANDCTGNSSSKQVLRKERRTQDKHLRTQVGRKHRSERRHEQMQQKQQ